MEWNSLIAHDYKSGIDSAEGRGQTPTAVTGRATLRVGADLMVQLAGA
jgi:hypothetical protein